MPSPFSLKSLFALKMLRPIWESSCGPRGAFHTEILDIRGHFRGTLCAHSRVHFHEHFRERLHGSNFAVRVLCAFLRMLEIHQTMGPEVGFPPETLHVEFFKYFCAVTIKCPNAFSGVAMVSRLARRVLCGNVVLSSIFKFPDWQRIL